MTVLAVCVYRLARLMLLLDGHLEEKELEAMFGQLQEKVAWLTERPYLPEGMAFRTLTLLKCLTEVRPARSLCLLSIALSHCACACTSL